MENLRYSGSTLQPDISVLSVTYNSESVIPEFLATLDRVVNTLHLSVETILTDNGSEDETEGILRDASQKYPELNMSVVVNKKNIGLSQALNHMLDLCKGKRILVCNPDIAFTESIREMLKISELRSESILVPELLEANGEPQREINRRFPTVLRVVSEYTTIGHSVPKLFDRIRRDYKYSDRRFRLPVDALEQISTVCMLLDPAVARILSPLHDPAFPVYWNDVDMCKRAEVLGIQRVIVPAARVYHGLGRSVKKGSQEKLAMLFFSSHGMIGYAQRWGMHPYLLRLALFFDTYPRIMKDFAKRIVGRSTRKLAQGKVLKSFKETTRGHILNFRCSLM